MSSTAGSLSLGRRAAPFQSTDSKAEASQALLSQTGSFLLLLRVLDAKPAKPAKPAAASKKAAFEPAAAPPGKRVRTPTSKLD